MSVTFGPQTEAGEAIHAEKHRQRGETFREATTRVASVLCDSDEHFQSFREIIQSMRFLPGGRIQAGMGGTRFTTPYNCFVSGKIEDSFTHGSGSIMARAAEAADTMRLGGGIGYDFSTLRPRGELIKKLDSQSSGSVSFMDIFDAVGLATASSGHRRGAQMGVLRVDHPDIEEFVRAKQNTKRLTGFNISVAITDEFMHAVRSESEFPLRFNKKIYRLIDAKALFDMIMRSTYDWSEPGVLFIDTINNNNNLRYCETIAATNPCGEQPLPPYGACLLGSFNLVKYLRRDGVRSRWQFNYRQLFADIPSIVRAMDNVVDRARYPLHEQEQEARNKRRMGLGVTGLANTIEALGASYGEKEFLQTTSELLNGIKNAVYRSSAKLAAEKEPFPLFEKEAYLASPFIQRLSPEVRSLIEEHGIRNSHLLSIAPTGTISLSADNVSSGIEPVYSYRQARTINTFSGPKTVEIEDYGVAFLNTRGKTVEECTAEDHLGVLKVASYHVDSAVSKTCNIPKDFPWENFKNFYFDAWESGCKGCTTYRSGGQRDAIIVKVEEESIPVLPSCEIDPISGRQSCE